MKAPRVDRNKNGTLSSALVPLSSPQSWMLSHQPSFLSQTQV